MNRRHFFALVAALFTGRKALGATPTPEASVVEYSYHLVNAMPANFHHWISPMKQMGPEYFFCDGSDIYVWPPLRRITEETRPANSRKKPSGGR